MNWYLVKMVFGIKTLKTQAVTQFDEQVRLVSARNENEAFLKARLIGVREEELSLNDTNSEVCWEFIDVSELSHFEMNDGVEIASVIKEVDHADSYKQFIYQKASRIGEKTGSSVAADY